jgi:Skp family chaperone for outer membrane proteins
MRPCTFSYVLPLGVVVVLGAGAAALRESPLAGTTGAVDLGKVFDGSAKWKDMRKLMADRREVQGKEIDGLAAEVEKLKADIEKLDPSSADYVKAQGQIIQKEALVNALSAQYEWELGRSEETQHKAVIDEINAVIGVLAKELGLSLVIQREMENADGIWASVLYVDPRLDLTDRVIVRLNKRYETEKK